MKKPDWKIWIEDEKECKLWLANYIKRKVLRESENESGLYLRKADHDLNLANWIFERHEDDIPEIFGEETFYDWIIDIYYYSIYHAASALMNKEGYDSKNHSATLCFLIYHHYHLQKAFDKEDVELIVSSFDKEDIETIGSSKELREKACYDIHRLFEKKLAEYVREKAVDFVNKIKILLKDEVDKKEKEEKNKQGGNEKGKEGKNEIEKGKDKKDKQGESEKEKNIKEEDKEKKKAEGKEKDEKKK